CEEGFLEIVKLLIHAGADTTVRLQYADGSKLNPLAAAIHFGRRDIVNYLCWKGVKLAKWVSISQRRKELFHGIQRDRMILLSFLQLSIKGTRLLPDVVRVLQSFLCPPKLAYW